MSLFAIKDDVNCINTERSRNRLCALLNLPLMTDLPRPGAARTWEHADWLELLAPYGFSEGNQTAHNYVIKHDRLPGLRIGMSTSPGDTRSRANFAQSVRYIFRNEYDLMTQYLKYVVSLFDSKADTESLDSICASIKHDVLTGYPSCRKDPKYVAYRKTEFIAASLETCSDGVLQELRSALAKASKCTKKSERELIKLVMAAPTAFADTPNDEVATDEIREALTEKLATCIRLSVPPPAHTSAILLTGLKDIIDVETAVREEAVKQRRETVRAAPIEVADETVPVARDLTVVSDIEYAQKFASIRGKFNGLSGPLIAALNDALVWAKAISEFAASFPTPSYPSVFIADLQQRNVELSNRQEGWKTQVFEAQQRTIAAEHRLAELKESLTAATELVDEAADNLDWKTKYADLVTSLTQCLSPNDFLALAKGVEEARAKLSNASIELTQ